MKIKSESIMRLSSLQKSVYSQLIAIHWFMRYINTNKKERSLAAAVDPASFSGAR